MLATSHSSVLSPNAACQPYKGPCTLNRTAFAKKAWQPNISTYAAGKEHSQAAPRKPQDKQVKQGSGDDQGSSRTFEQGITPKSVDFSKWYLDLVSKAELADYGPVRGTMVIRPYGYAIWEAIQSHLDAKFKERGVQNAYFPQLIPLSLLSKEAAHVQGFAPELALVTKGGGRDLEEPLALRPTSEALVNALLPRWVRSHRDLPLRLNQWTAATRWEMRTRPFLRTTEFLWQEGHTVHATAQEAREEAEAMAGVYQQFASQVAGLAVVAGRKSRAESFAGAQCTLTLEAMMGDRRALQAATAHDLGTNFAQAFNTHYLDDQGRQRLVHQSSWGASTRLVGGVIMAHGDDQGLRLPPLLAPIQVVIVPIVKHESERGDVMQAVAGMEVAAKAAGIRVKVDADVRQTPGWKFNHWEMKGVPLRVEVGPRDVSARQCVVARRDRPGKQGKQVGVPMEGDAFVAYLQRTLEEVQAALQSQAQAFMDANIEDVRSYGELREAVAAGKWARGGWAGSDADERRVKEDTQATLRCFPFDQPPGQHTCLMTGLPAAEVALFAKSY